MQSENYHYRLLFKVDFEGFCLVEKHGALAGALSVWGAFFIFAKYEIRCRYCLINHLHIVSQSALRSAALGIPDNGAKELIRPEFGSIWYFK